MDLQHLRASDGTGEAVLAHVQSVRTIGSTVLDLDNIDNWNSKCIVVTGTPNANGFISSSGMTVMYGHTSAGDFIIDGYAPGYSDAGNTTTQIAIVKMTTSWADALIDLLDNSLNDDGTLKISAVEAVTPGGYRTGVLPAISSITHNGNGSYDVVFASTVAGILSNQMKFRASRTVAAPTYMGGLLNGSSHYFVKASPTSTLSTVTNNFTLMATVELATYQHGAVLDRCDAAANNTLELMVNSSGQVRVQVSNGGSANYRYIDSTMCLTLGKKYHIAATWASGTVLIYINGISVPVATAVTGGTAPTTAGTGGDFAIGRRGASANLYFSGYISGAAAFNAVLSEATIRSYIGQALSGAETNCIGAWSLNNTAVNQQAPGTNDLTATGGVGYTSGRAPYATDSSGVALGSLEYGLVMKVATTTATIQVPEGCSLPTSGGMTAPAYSTDGIPYLFPLDPHRWELESLLVYVASQSSPVSNTYYNVGSLRLTMPIGNWKLTGELAPAVDRNTGGAVSVTSALSTSSSSVSKREYLRNREIVATGATGLSNFTEMTCQDTENVSTATTFYALVMTPSTSINTMYFLGDRGICRIKALPVGIGS